MWSKTGMVRSGLSRRERWSARAGAAARRCLVGLVVVLCATSAGAQQSADFFRGNCFNCHTIGGGRLTGPDLKGVAQRQNRAWLEKFIANPKAVIDSGDAYALKLQGEARGVVMPIVNGLNAALIKSLLDLVEQEAALPQSQFVGIQIGNEPFTNQDRLTGWKLFIGQQKLKGGGPACVGCHTTGTIGSLGGGRLGPDLTKVLERLQGRRALAAWLVSPASPTMQPVYRGRALANDEILPLVALLENALQKGREADMVGRLNFLLCGLAGAVIGLLLFDFTWRGRFRSVRRSLVRRATAR